MAPHVFFVACMALIVLPASLVGASQCKDSCSASASDEHTSSRILASDHSLLQSRKLLTHSSNDHAISVHHRNSVAETPASECDESAWPDKDHGLVCGSCKVLVNNFASVYMNCDRYCSAVGLGCKAAWEEVDDDCNIKHTLACNESIDSSDAICECDPLVHRTPIPADSAKGGGRNNSFTVVIIPDTQFMVGAIGWRGAQHEQWLAQGDWIVQQKEWLNIQAVVHVGDLVEDAWVDNNWKLFFEGWSKIESTGLPWSAVPGNHDCWRDGGCQDANRWQYYNAQMAPHWDAVNFQPEFKEAGKYENNVVLFEYAGVKMMIVGIEYIPRQESLDWAERKLAEHPDRRAIINIHYVEGTDVQSWAKRQRNIFMIHQGHDCAREWNIEYTNDWGEPIQEILADYQCSGNGFLRYYTFDLNTDTVQAYTYHPHERRYEDDSNSQFSFGFSRR